MVSSYSQAYRGVVGKLRVSGSVTSAQVVQLQFSPSIGIVARDIDKLGIDIRSFKEPLKRAVQKVVIPSIQANFSAQGRPSWEAYSEGTEDIRTRMGEPTGSLLNKSGKLQSVMNNVNLWTINTNAAILLDLPLWYGKVQQSGYDGGSMKALIKKTGSASSAFHAVNARLRETMASGGSQGGGGASSIPARPFVMLQPEDEDGITEVFIEWLQERIERNWSSRG